MNSFKKGLQEVFDENESSFFAALNAVPNQPIDRPTEIQWIRRTMTPNLDPGAWPRTSKVFASMVTEGPMLK